MLKTSVMAFLFAVLLSVSNFPSMAADKLPGKPAPGAQVAAPANGYCFPIPFEAAEVLGEGRDYRLRITVLKGALPAGWVPTLTSFDYFMQPEYWGVVLMACQAAMENNEHKIVSDDGISVIFEEAVSVGTKGIELEGGKRQKFDIATTPAAAELLAGEPPLGAPAVVPADGKCTTIPFESAELVGEKGRHRLRIAVLKQNLPEGWTPKLIAVMYVMQPDYWRVVLMACQVIKPDSTHKTLSDDGTTITFEEPVVSIGSKGIELEGGELRKFDVAP